MARGKHIEYYMNGVRVDKKTVTARKDKRLTDIEITTTKHYDAPLNDSEKAERQKDAQNSIKFWREHAELREDMDKKYG